MNEQTLKSELDAVAAMDGIRACAAVDSDSGLVWHASGTEPGAEPLWEAAIDYWRLHGRSQAHFATLGPLGAAVLYHHKAVLALIPCAGHDGLVAVCIASHQGVQWREVQRRIQAMSRKLTAR